MSLSQTCLHDEHVKLEAKIRLLLLHLLLLLLPPSPPTKKGRVYREGDVGGSERWWVEGFVVDTFWEVRRRHLSNDYKRDDRVIFEL